MSSKYDRCALCGSYIEGEARVASEEYEGYAHFDCYLMRKNGGGLARLRHEAHTSNLGHLEIAGSNPAPRSTNSKGKLRKQLDAKKLDQSYRKLTDGYILIPMTVYDVLDEAAKELERRLRGCDTEKAYVVYRDFFKEYFGEQK